MRVRIFVDFWNFQLNWNDRVPESHCDWSKLPSTLIGATHSLLTTIGQDETLKLEETLVYASVKPNVDAPLKKWLGNTVGRMPSYRINIRERQPQRARIHCKSCNSFLEGCSVCGEPYIKYPEKGVDSAIVTDLLSLAFQKSYDLAILLSSDADFIPAVDYLQGTAAIQVINASWRGHGHNLKKTCWGSFDLDEVVSGMVR